MARFCTLFSSSSGNSVYIGSGTGGIIIDAGVSAKRIALGLAEHSIDPCSIHAIFVTHEHTDHISGLRALASRHGIRVYATNGTLAELERMDRLCAKFSAMPMEPQGISAGGMLVYAFETSHDCAESCGFIIRTPDDRKIGICTDLGHVTDTVRQALLGCDLVMLESNHDVMMLQNGSYPYPLKRRIQSDVGHLSNTLCAAELAALIDSGTTRIVLAHLSRENNHPDVALATARAALCSHRMVEGQDYLLSVAPREGGRMMIL